VSLGTSLWTIGMETTATRTTFETKATDGLFELVHRAAKAAASNELDSGGMLEIRAAGLVPGTVDPLAVEAEFSDDGLRRTIAKLDVHVRTEAAADATVIEQAVARFGGSKYTNVCFSTPLAQAEDEEDDLELLRPRTTADDALDITIDCSSSLPFYASNLALTSATLSTDEVEAAAECLKELGVSFSRPGKSSIRVAKFQLRGPVRSAAQAAAFAALSRRGLTVSLYSATIPTTQSVRVAWRVEPTPSGERREGLELCFSRGLAGTEGTSKEHVQAIDAFIREHFGVGVAEGQWTVESRKWTAGSESEAEKKSDS
jgi:hypothetical protein